VNIVAITTILCQLLSATVG